MITVAWSQVCSPEKEGGLCGVATLSNNLLALAAPISPPDTTTCGPADLPPDTISTDCCPPSSTNIIDFKFPSSTQNLTI
ncbi:hypothetical protein Lal_00038734 [Lupinus albus]|nr:hypothetical protein Lal_00038734 [Lupinus albus]